MTPIQATFRKQLEDLRKACLIIERDVRGLTPCVSDLPPIVEMQEVNANLMIAVRRLEDARMRLGKAIQWGCEDGVSIYDQKKPVKPSWGPGEGSPAEDESGFGGPMRGG